MKPKSVSFRIRRVYFDQIVAGTKKEELRSNTPFWRVRLFGSYINPPFPPFKQPEIAVFICGKDVHRRKIVGIETAKPEEVLRRPLSKQGKRDITTRMAFVIKLGEEWRSDVEE